ncbi:MAG: hypothetical protein WCV88_03205 [Patescibacteria group bacterium]|jgi:hypothetical protein
MYRYWLICLVCISVPVLGRAAAETSLADFASITNTAASQFAGTAVANVGDLNADGYQDMIVSAPSAGTNSEGAVYIIYGQAARIDEIVFPDQPTITGETAGDKLGEQLGGLGDINGDGFDDFAVVSNYHDSSNSNPGTIYIVYGQISHITNQSVKNFPRFYGENSKDGAGAAVQGVGDMDGDGYDDFAIGATWRSSRSGGVYLVYGQAASFSTTEDLGDYTLLSGDSYDYTGSAIAAGDVTNDGVSDIIVTAHRHDGSTRDAGYVYIVPGQTTHYTNQALDNFSNIAGQTRNEKIGDSLAVGDVTGDGYNDIVIGAPASDADASNAGRVYIMSGASSLPESQSINSGIILTTAFADDALGTAVTVLKDLNHDGIDDLLLGAPSNLDNQAGRAFLVLGSTSLTSHNVTDDYPFTGEAEADLAAAKVAAVDFNGDGASEIVVAASQYNSGNGKVYIGYWPIYTCENSVTLGGILANYPTTDYKLRKYARNRRYRIVVEKVGQQAWVVNCATNTIVQTLTFNDRAQRKILARVFAARHEYLFIAVTRTPSKRKIKVFLYKQQTKSLLETQTFTKRWRPRGFRIKLGKKNRVTLQAGQEAKHKLHYLVTRNLQLDQLN